MKIASAFLKKQGGETTEVRLWELDFPTVDEDFLIKRDALIANERFDSEMFSLARQFAAADSIVIAAPYWDLSFPATLKQYFEQINVLGITFSYSPEGIPQGLCKAKNLYYITTAGGSFCPFDYGFGYIKSLAENFYGIPQTTLIKATSLDLITSNPDEIVQRCIDSL